MHHYTRVVAELLHCLIHGHFSSGVSSDLSDFFSDHEKKLGISFQDLIDPDAGIIGRSLSREALHQVGNPGFVSLPGDNLIHVIR